MFEQAEIACYRRTAILIFLLVVMAKGLTFPCWNTRGLDRRQKAAALNDYDQFAIEFERVLNSSDWCNSGHVSRLEDDDIDGELSPYYRRDHFDGDRSEIPAPEALKRLLKQRYEARKLKDFALVDTLDKQLLRDHGVRVSSHPAIWTRSKAPRAFLRRLARKKQLQLQRLYGPVGHPYEQVGREMSASTGTALSWLSLPQVHTSLSRRTRCRMEGRYEEADAIKFELSLHGIRIHDDFLQWTSDDQHTFTPKSQSHYADHPQQAPEYRENPTCLQSDSNKTDLRFGGRTLEEDDKRRRQRVTQLLEIRSGALVRGDFRLANSIAYELEKTYNVLLDDNSRSWWIQDHEWPSTTVDVRSAQVNGVRENSHEGDSSKSMFPRIILGDEVSLYDGPVKYTRSSLSGQLGDSSWSERVEALVQERIHKREEGCYLESDAIRRELWHTYNVGVSDRVQQYSVGGVFDKLSST